MEDTYFKRGGGAGTTGLPAGDDPGVCKKCTGRERARILKLLQERTKSLHPHRTLLQKDSSTRQIK